MSRRGWCQGPSDYDGSWKTGACLAKYGMFEFLKRWIVGDQDDDDWDMDELRAEAARESGAYRPARRRSTGPAPSHEPAPTDAELVDREPRVEGRIEDAGPGKNVLVKSRYVREDTGTHETLKIVDDSLVDGGEEDGIDPYNTGEFDRSRNWDKRFRN